jgi:hypothetical protein
MICGFLPYLPGLRRFPWKRRGPSSAGEGGEGQDFEADSAPSPATDAVDSCLTDPVSQPWARYFAPGGTIVGLGRFTHALCRRDGNGDHTNPKRQRGFRRPPPRLRFGLIWPVGHPSVNRSRAARGVVYWRHTKSSFHVSLTVRRLGSFPIASASMYSRSFSFGRLCR